VWLLGMAGELWAHHHWRLWMPKAAWVERKTKKLLANLMRKNINRN